VKEKKGKKMDVNLKKESQVVNANNSVSFVVISGLDFPKRSRKYLMNLTKEVVEKHKAMFVIIAGHIMNGKELDDQLKKLQKI
jgi:hypothetical protein